MDPPFAHSTRDLYDGTRRVLFDDRPHMVAESTPPNRPSTSRKPDDIERADLEEENRLLKHYPGMIVDKNFKYACSGKTNLASSPATTPLNDKPTDYSRPGCSKDADDSNSTIKKMITSRTYPTRQGTPYPGEREEEQQPEPQQVQEEEEEEETEYVQKTGDAYIEELLNTNCNIGLHNTYCSLRLLRKDQPPKEKKRPDKYSFPAPMYIKAEKEDEPELVEDDNDKVLIPNEDFPTPFPIKEEKEDFMQKLINSNIEEKKDYPKGKLYRAEAMEGVDIEISDASDLNISGPSGRTSSNASSIGSASSDSTKETIVPSTSNADKLLGLDGKSKKRKTSKPKNYGKCYQDDSDDELNEESWCTCLSSHEDDDDEDEPEPVPEPEPVSEPEPERIWRKRRGDPQTSHGGKKFCPDGSFDNSSSQEPWMMPGGSGMQPNVTSQGPPELKQWLNRFSSWTNSEKTEAIDALISRCAAGQVRHMMKAIEPLFQRDFISLLPKELALAVLGFLPPKDLLRSAQTCRYWRFLADDNLLWKEKCRRIGITTLKKMPRSLPRCASPWKAAYMRQYLIEDNWLHKSVNNPFVMRGHDEHVITCLQFCGNRILSGSDDSTLRVWSAVTGKCLRTLIGHAGGVWSSQMVGHLVISGSTDRTLRVWNAKSGHCIKVLAGHTSTVRCLHLHDNRVVSGSRDATLRVWSLPDGRCLRVLVGHIAAVRCVQFDGKYVVSGAYDYFVKVWNPDSGECLHTLSGHTNRVYSLQFDGVHVVSGSLDTSIRVWEVETGQLKHTLTGHQSLTSGMELNSNILVSGNADSTVKVWDITTGHCLHTLAGPNKHQSAVTCLQTRNRFVITSSDDGTVKLWDVHTGEFIRNLVELSSGGSGGVVWRIRASATKLVCAVGSRNGTEETKLLVLDFDIPGACRRCNE